jgi:hypothetical protein
LAAVNLSVDNRVGPARRQPKAVWAVAFACIVAFMGIGLVGPTNVIIAGPGIAGMPEAVLGIIGWRALWVLGNAFLSGLIDSRITERSIDSTLCRALSPPWRPDAMLATK